METGDLKILLALEPQWTVSLNGREFLALHSAEISIVDSTIRFGRYSRKIVGLEWLRPNVVRIYGKAKFQSQTDAITFYPGERLPSAAELRRRRTSFQSEMAPALCSFFGVRKIQRQTLYSDRRYGIGAAYPRFIVGDRAVIAVDPDESSAVVNGLMRAALLWAPLVRRRVAAVAPYGRHHTIAARLRHMPRAEEAIEWLQWDGRSIRNLDESSNDPETHVHPLLLPDAASEVARVCAVAPHLLQPVPHIAGSAISIRLRGIEVARISGDGITYPLGEPLRAVVSELDDARRYGSRHPLARAHEERWLESNLLADLGRLLPSIDSRYVYPQVPSFVGEQRSIIDLLTITDQGRLVVIEIKAAPDPDLPFQALDYWIAVERHRRGGDFQGKGYFVGRTIQNEPALLVLVAPLLAYHKTAGRMIGMLPATAPLIEIGINQSWKKAIQVLRRRGIVS